MSKRGVNLNFPTCPEPRVIAWLEANNIDPMTVPAAQEVLVTDEHIAYVRWVSDPETGAYKIMGGDGWLKEIVVAPLLSAPEDHNL
jgi:hypothetical protein